MCINCHVVTVDSCVRCVPIAAPCDVFFSVSYGEYQSRISSDFSPDNSTLPLVSPDRDSTVTHPSYALSQRQI